jgi:hypothetical protein
MLVTCVTNARCIGATGASGGVPSSTATSPTAGSQNTPVLLC